MYTSFIQQKKLKRPCRVKSIFQKQNKFNFIEIMSAYCCNNNQHKDVHVQNTQQIRTKYMHIKN